MKIVIAGFGVEGQSNLRYFREKFPEADFLVADEREKVDNLPENVTYQAGFLGLENADLIVRSPRFCARQVKPFIWWGISAYQLWIFCRKLRKMTLSFTNYPVFNCGICRNLRTLPWC